MKSFLLIFFIIIFTTGCEQKSYYNPEAQKYLDSLSRQGDNYINYIINEVQFENNIFKVRGAISGHTYDLFKEITESGSENLYIVFTEIDPNAEMKEAYIEFKDGNKDELDYTSKKVYKKVKKRTGTTYGSKGGVYYDYTEVEETFNAITIPISPTLAKKMFKEPDFVIVLSTDVKKYQLDFSEHPEDPLFKIHIAELSNKKLSNN